jgi:hypothetical protein
MMREVTRQRDIISLPFLPHGLKIDNEFKVGRSPLILGSRDQNER